MHPIEDVEITVPGYSVEVWKFLTLTNLGNVWVQPLDSARVRCSNVLGKCMLVWWGGCQYVLRVTNGLGKGVGTDRSGDGRDNGLYILLIACPRRMVVDDFRVMIE